MKKVFISLFIVVAFAINTYSQEKKFEFGFQGGFSSDIPSTATDTLFNTYGGHFGPIFTYYINEMFGIQAGILYDYYSGANLLTGASTKKLTGNWNENNTKAQYLNLPIRFQYSVPVLDDFNFHLFGGPNLNFGLNRKVYDARYASNQLLSGYPKPLKDYYSSSLYSPLDVQFGIGAAMQYFHYSLRVTYDWGILNRAKSYGTFKANNLKIGVAYTF